MRAISYLLVFSLTFLGAQVSAMSISRVFGTALGSRTFSKSHELGGSVSHLGCSFDGAKIYVNSRTHRISQIVGWKEMSSLTECQDELEACGSQFASAYGRPRVSRESSRTGLTFGPDRNGNTIELRCERHPRFFKLYRDMFLLKLYAISGL